MNKIRELRKEYNYSQTELANLCKTTTSNVSGWECGKWQPDNETLIRLANIFNVTVDYLLGRTEWTNEDKVQGVRRSSLSAAEYEWLDLRSGIIQAKGEKYLETVITMLKALI